MAQKYAFQGNEENTAKAFGRRLPISTKQSIMICKAIKGKKVDYAKKVLEGAIRKERPIKFTRFMEGAGHKPGAGAGKYPVKACENILKVLNSAEANAQHIGLASNLVVVHAAAHQASRGYKYGRKRGRKEKSTHIEIVVKEIGGLKPKVDKKAKKEEKEDKVEEKEEKQETKEKAEEKAEEDKEDNEESKDIPAKSTVSNMTKDEIKQYAKEEWNVKLSTNDLKDEMIDQLFEEIGDEE